MTDSTLPPQREMDRGPRSFSRPTFRTQFGRFPVTYILIGLTILVYVGQEISTFMYDYDVVLSIGAKINEAIYAGEWWRFFTPIFIHVDILHIFVNMYSLNAIGPTVESFFGRPRMLIVFICSGIVGVIFSLAFTPNASAGASGAIFGLLGSLGMFLFLHKDILGEVGRTYLRRIALVALINLGLGLAPNIDNWGHLGGLLAGAAIAWFMCPKFEVNWDKAMSPNKLVEKRPWKDVQTRIFPLVMVILLLAYLAIQSPLSG